jgi:hypothetical protein
MKIKLTIELDLPDECSSFSDGELSQLLFDEYVNYATCAHLEDATHWCCEARVGTEDENLQKKIIYEHHKIWGNICDAVTWKYERVNP